MKTTPFRARRVADFPEHGEIESRSRDSEGETDFEREEPRVRATAKGDDGRGGERFNEDEMRQSCKVLRVTPVMLRYVMFPARVAVCVDLAIARTLASSTILHSRCLARGIARTLRLWRITEPVARIEIISARSI